MSDLVNATFVNILSNGVRSATFYSDDVPASAYLGMGRVILTAAAQGSGVTLNAKLQQSAGLAVGAAKQTEGGNDYTLNAASGGRTKLAAKFTQSGARTIKEVYLRLKKAGTIASDRTLTVTIAADSSGPSTTLGTAGTVLADTIATAYGWVRFVFSTPVNVANGTAYWIVLECNYSASDTNNVKWEYTTVSGTGNASTYVPTTWTADTNKDFLFFAKQYTFTDVSGAAFAEVGNAAAAEAITVNLDAIQGFIRLVGTVAGGSATGATAAVMLARKQVI